MRSVKKCCQCPLTVHALQCTCNELLTDTEGIKWDQVIAERGTQSCVTCTKKIEDVLTKLQSDHNDMRHQIDNLKQETRD